jgi:hyperosmotically inducible protein
MKINNKIWMTLALASASFAPATFAAPTQPPKPLQERVRRELATIPYLSVFDDFYFSVDNGAVTLMGAVTRPYIKDYAEKSVRNLPGVTSVSDQIEVLPLSSFDDNIRVRTLRAIERTGSLYRYFMGVNPSIRIVVKNSNVTLDGFVANAADSQLANMAANRVPNVFSVTNNLRIEPKQ